MRVSLLEIYALFASDVMPKKQNEPLSSNIAIISWVA